MPTSPTDQLAVALGFSPAEGEYLTSWLDAERGRARERGRTETLDVLKALSALNGSTEAVMALVRKATGFDESKHHRDHGKFSATDGASDAAEIADLEGKLRRTHARRAEELERAAADGRAVVDREIADGVSPDDDLVQMALAQIALLERYARERRELAAGRDPDALAKAWREDQHKRDHGKFSTTTGGSGDGERTEGVDRGRVRDDRPVPRDDTERTAQGGAGADPDTKAQTLAARIKEVPQALARRVSLWVQAKYAKLSARYGPTGAKLVMGAIVALLPVPVPGSSLLPIAVAEAVLRIRGRGEQVKAVPTTSLSDSHAAALARDLWHDLMEEMGGQVDQNADSDPEGATKPHESQPSGGADQVDPPADGDAPDDLYDTDSHALLAALISDVHDAAEGGDDPTEAAERYRELIDQMGGESVGKALISVNDLRAGERHDWHDPAPYGYCPECREPGICCERRIDGDAQCADGHSYPRKRAKYASTQVELTGAAKRKLLALSASIPDADLGDDGREDAPHVTARYGLHVNDPGAVAEAVAGFGPVRVALRGLKAFRGAETGKGYDVIYAEVDSPDLHRLHAALGAVPHTDTWPEYHPHATVAYVKAGLADKYLAELGAVDESAEIDRLTFSTAKREHTVIDLTVTKAARFDSAQHPRDDNGRFVSRDAIHDAKTALAAGDSSKADALRERVTAGIEREKLDDALAGTTDLGRTQAHQNREGVEQRRKSKEESKKRADELIRKISAGQLQPASSPYSAEDLHALADHLPHMTVADLRRARMALHASFGGDRRKEQMVERLRSHARGEAHDMTEASADEARDWSKVKPGGLFSAPRRKPSAAQDAEDAGVKVPAIPDADADEIAALGARNAEFVARHRESAGAPADAPGVKKIPAVGGYAKKPASPATAPAAPTGGLSEAARSALAAAGKDPERLTVGDVSDMQGKVSPAVLGEIAGREMRQRFARSDAHAEWANRGDKAPAKTDLAPAPRQEPATTPQDAPPAFEPLSATTFRSRGAAESAAADYGPHASAAKIGGKWRVVARKQGAQGAPPSSLSDEEFARQVQAAADGHTHGFGDNKVFIADVFDALKAENPSLDRAEFDRRLLDAHRADALSLSRADLVQLMDPDAVRRSEVKHPLGADYHFVQAAPKDRRQRPRDAAKDRADHAADLRAYAEKERRHAADVRAKLYGADATPTESAAASKPYVPPAASGASSAPPPAKSADDLVALYEGAKDLHPSELPSVQDFAALKPADRKRAAVAMGLPPKAPPRQMWDAVQMRWGMTNKEKVFGPKPDKSKAPTDSPMTGGNNAPAPPTSGGSTGGAEMGFTRPVAKERTNDKGVTFAHHDGDPAAVKGDLIVHRDAVHPATVRPDGALAADREATQTYARHGLIAAKGGSGGTPRVYAAALKDGRPGVFFAEAESGADFAAAANTLRAAGLDPAEHLPHAAAHTFGTGKRPMLSRVHEYLRAGGVEPPAPATGTPSDREALAAANPRDTAAKMALADATREAGDGAAADHMQAAAELDRHQTVLAAAKERLSRARAALPSAFQSEMGATATPEALAEHRAAEAEHRAAASRQNELVGALSAARASARPPAARAGSRPPVTIRGNTFAVRAELAKIPGAKYSARLKKWTVPAEHAEAAKKLVAGAPASDPADLLKLSDADLAERGLVRTSGPRGPYVRRGTPEELDDHL